MGTPCLLCPAFWIFGNYGCVFTHISISAGHSLCGDPDSSVETAPEEAEVQDLESSDEADKMSKVRKFHFHVTRSESAVRSQLMCLLHSCTQLEHLSWENVNLTFKVFTDDIECNKLQLWLWHITTSYARLVPFFQGWFTSSIILWYYSYMVFEWAGLSYPSTEQVS